MIRIITTFSRKQWDDYVHKLLPRSLSLWPVEVEWQVWLDDRDALHPSMVSPARALYLSDDPEHEAFMAKWNTMVRNRPNLRRAITADRHAMLAGAIPQQGYTFDAGMFAHKVFALTSMEARRGCDWLLFLGSDVETLANVDSVWLDRVLGGGDLVHLGRRDIRSSETDFLAIRIDSWDGDRTCDPDCPYWGQKFLDSLRAVYTSGDLFHWAEWIDGYAIARLIAIFQGMGAEVKNLSQGLPGLDVWDKSILGERMTHHKGRLGKAKLMEAIKV